MTNALAMVIASAISALGGVLAALVSTRTGAKKQVQSTTSGKGTIKSFLFIAVGLLLGAAVGGTLSGVLMSLETPPSARITAPADGEPVPMLDTLVTIEYRHVPKDRHVWLVIRIPGIGASSGLIYPMTECIEAPAAGHGTFTAKVQFGGDADAGRPFNLVVLSADEQANIDFLKYRERCAHDSSLCNGFPFPDKGVTILGFNTVIRK